MRMRMLKRTIVTVLVAAGLLPVSVEAQEAVWTYRAQPTGWIGISVDYQGWISVEGEEGTLVVITEVVEGSPADQQGLRVGDTITHIDGRPVSQQVFLKLRETLQPEDLVRMVVVREGAEREIMVEAGTRAEPVVVPSTDIDQLVITLDTIRGAILEDLESLTLSIAGLHLDAERGEMSVQLLRVPSREVEFATQGTIFRFPEAVHDTLALGGEAFVLDPGFSLPFQAYFVQSQASDSLRVAMSHLRRELTDVRRQELSRQRQIMASIQGPPEEHLRSDELIQALRAQEMELIDRQEQLSRQLSQVLEEESRRQWAEASARSSEAWSRAQRASQRSQTSAEETQRQRERAREIEEIYRSQVRYRTPQIWGENFVLGADLKPLNPALAEIFAVEQGVVVWEVPDGTPAAEFGLRGGDVIVRIAGQEIRSIGDVRLSLEALGRPLPVYVVRKGEAEPVEVIIRK
jgi:type II secretory pathway component PulC